MIVDIAVKPLLEINPKAEAIHKDLRYGSKQRYKLDLRMLDEDERSRLIIAAKAQKAFGYRQLMAAVETMKLMRENPTGVPIVKMRELQTALIEHFIKNAPRKWVFKTQYGQRFPYYVDNIAYHPTKHSEGWTTWEHVTMHLRAVGDSNSTVTFSLDDLADKPNVIRALQNKGYRTESPDLVERYEDEMERYNIIVSAIGELYGATGTAIATDDDSWWSTDKRVAMEREGSPSKVIIDDGSEQDVDDDRGNRYRGRNRNKRTKDTGPSVVDATWWRKAGDPKKAGKAKKEKWDTDDDDDDDDQAPDAFKVDSNGNEIPTETLPKHPWVPIFDLARHQFLEIHANELDPWTFDASLGDKLVLPQGTMAVLNALVRGSAAVMEDIVKGKTGGTIILATGDPGTGKTLSAEVFAEIMQKPLYTVQCSQLGLNPAELEKELGIVLARANRWKCILLIDEADVYVRTRGEDIIQNAMVGVWLRVLEYFRGVLFMTSNKATEIDDAVMSRATAWIKYDRPSREELARIWAVLLAQYEMETPTDLIPLLVEEWPRATGRNVKNLIKLARNLRMAGTEGDDLVLFKMAGRFLDVDTGKDKVSAAKSAR